MKFTVECSVDPSHHDFWTSVPVTTYWSVVDGKMVWNSDGKVWPPDRKDDWFCQECGEAAITKEL
jgi:hypothetical protein